MKATIALLSVLAASTLPAAQGGSSRADRRDEIFKKLAASAVAATQANLKKEVSLHPRQSEPVRSSALDPDTAAASAQRLSLALKTDVEGAAAGVVLAPFAFRKPGSAAAGFAITLAALKDDKFRAGTGFSHRSRPIEFSDLPIATCDSEEDMKKRLASLRPAWDAACEAGIDLLNDPPPETGKPPEVVQSAARRWALAREACGNSVASPAMMPTTMLIEVVFAVNSTLEAAERDRPQIEIVRNVPQDRRATLKKFQSSTFVSCRTDDEYRDAFARVSWQRRSVQFGVLLDADFYARHSGFNPDESKPLSNGETDRWQIRGNLEIAQGRTTAVLGLGYGKSREALDKPLYAWMSPSMSISTVAFSLSGRSLMNGSELNLEDGELPPHAIVGFAARAEIAVGARPEGQTTAFRLVEITPFLDFKVSEKLGFRLGVPISGALVARDADEAKKITARRSLQWTIPFALTTVITH